MPRIHILDKQVAELIAAGEVVERPSSIVKELIENSIDAGATKITVEIKNGGVKYIRITDDGCGIERADVPNAFVRHATSKVLTAEDLESIYTFGFRGEALASVAAMCKVELLTRTKDEVSGTKYVIDGDDDGAFYDTGCPVGTTIVVRDIFYNTPARMKFLKKDMVEGNSVSTMIDRIALSNPGISIRYIRDGALKLNTPGNGDLLSAIHAVFGKEFTDGLIKADFAQGDIKVTGFISKPEAAKATRTMQSFFVNTRFVRSKTCSAALEEAYRNTIMTGKFPSCVLNVQIPPQTVDVNIHPAKIEVRFSDEKAVYDGVYSACKFVLNQHNQGLFTAQQTTKKTPINAFTLSAFDYTDKQERLNMSPAKPIAQQGQPTFSHISHTQYRETYGQSAPANRDVLTVRSPEAVPYRTHERQETPVGYSVKTIASQEDLEGSAQGLQYDEEQGTATAFRNQPQYTLPAPSQPDDEQGYPMPTSPEDVADIPQDLGYSEAPRLMTTQPHQDQQSTPNYTWRQALHVTMEKAQEQVAEIIASQKLENLRLVGELFATYMVIEGSDFMLLVDKHAAHERYLYNQLKASGESIDKQMLLTPVSVPLQREEYTGAIANLEVYSRLGFTAEDFGEGTILIREAPFILEKADIAALATEIAVKLLHHNRDATPQLLEDLYHSIACKSAIKANDKSSPLELDQLIALIAEDADIRYCPHGRPISIRMSKREIEKLFGRLG